MPGETFSRLRTEYTILHAPVKRRRLAETLFLGHLRYATYGRGDIGFCHPFVHRAARLNRTLFLAGNFNLTNTHDLEDERDGLQRDIAAAAGNTNVEGVQALRVRNGVVV